MEIDRWAGSRAAYWRISVESDRYRMVARRMVAMAELSTACRVVDLACGMGAIAEAVIDHTKRHGFQVDLVAVDSSAEMVATTSRRFSSLGVECVHARAEELDAIGIGSVDIVFCNAAFWHFEMREALGAVRRVLRPAGRFYVSLPQPTECGGRGQSALYARSKLAWLLLEEADLLGDARAAKSQPRRASRIDQLRELSRAAGFTLECEETVSWRPSATEALEFLEVPALAQSLPLFNGVPHDRRQEIVRVVRNEAKWLPITVAAKAWCILSMRQAHAD